MSETVQITIIIDDTRKESKVTHDLSKTLMSTLLEKKLISDNFCGGRGVCGRCRVQFLQAAPLPTTTERRVFSPEELRKGYRLACMAKPKNNCVVCLHFISSPKIDVITDMIAMSEKNDPKSQLQPDAQTRPQSSMQPDAQTRPQSSMQPDAQTRPQSSMQPDAQTRPQSSIQPDMQTQSEMLIAVDLGTTTIAMQLMDMESGETVDTYCALNPQRRYGADVVSRIQAASADEEAAYIMHEEVWKVIRSGVEQFRNTIDALRIPTQSLRLTDDMSFPFIRGLCIAGNTTMEHLLMGLPTESLGRSPFKPVEIGLQECRMPERNTIPARNIIPDVRCTDSEDADTASLPVYVVPGISTFVGGDIVAGLYCCRLLDAMCREQNTDGAVLFIDLGTNGEMAITDAKRMIVTATAAGPAFEGGAGASIHGSDMIAVTAFLLEQGMIDETGLLAEPYFDAGIIVPIPDKEETIRLTQKDIRALQMAKAAVRAGVEMLCEKMGNPVISQVFLAGGFGYYLNVDAALKIGLLPESMRGAAKAAGNTSLAGAFMIGRDLFQKRLTKETLERKLYGIECINLAEQKDFETIYLENLNFPK